MVKLAAEVGVRVKRLLELLAVSGLSGALLTRKSDVRYFSGFTGDDSVLLITRTHKYLLTDGRYVEEAEKTTYGYEILKWKEHPASFALTLLPQQGKVKLGVSDNDLKVNWYKKLLGGGLETAPIDSLVASVREQKSEWEIEMITKSLAVIEKAFREFKGVIKAGMSERELKLEFEYRMYRAGAEQLAFETIVAEGANSSLPHAHAGERVLREGSILLLDFGGVIDGYCSDLTRTLFCGAIAPLWRERYEIVLAAQQAGIVSFRAGREIQEIEKAARAVFTGAEVEKYFIHSLGHGVGMEVHEAPRVSLKAVGKIPLGAVVTVEPGLYFPGEGGIRIEDMVVVEKTRARVLSTLEKDIESVVVG